MDDKKEEALTTTEQSTQVLVEPSLLIPITDADLDVFEKNIEQQKKLRLIILKITNARDWVLFGDSPWLTKPGCDKVYTNLGIGRAITNKEKNWLKDELGSFYSWDVDGHVKFRGLTVDETGYADSRDPFFSMGKGGKRKPQSEICNGDIKKKAITNFYNRALERLVGRFSREEVEGSVGSLNESGSVNFKSKTSVQETGADSKLRSDLKAKIVEMCASDVDKCKAYCTEISAFTTNDGKEVSGNPEFSKWSIGRVKANQQRIESDYKNFKEGA